jgi:arylsulfatase A-like enzyme
MVQPAAMSPARDPEASVAARKAEQTLRAARHGLGLFAGFLAIATTNAVAIAAGAPWPGGGLRTRLLHHLFDALEVAALGVTAGLVVALWLKFVRGRLVVHLAAYAIAATAVMHAIVGRDLQRQALVALNGRFEQPIFIGFVVLTGLAIPTAHALGAYLGKFRRLRWLPLIAALGGLVTNQLIVRDDYPGLHGAIGWAAATLAGGALAPWAYAASVRARARCGTRPLALGLLVIVALALGLAPPNDVRLAMFREPGALAPWVFSEVVWPHPKVAALTAPPSPWFEDRSSAKPVPPSSPPLFVGQPIVVMITVDALRADAIEDDANDARFPTFAALKRSSAYFTRATTPGGQTTVSLSTTFSGRYFSSLAWTMHGDGVARFLYPADDPSPRFPALLAEHGVTTANVASLNFLASDFGVIRGFTEEQVVPRGRTHAMAKALIDPIIQRLSRAGPEPLFLYTHLMEPHAPYDRGSVKQGADHERYLSEIAVVDAQLARVVKLLDRRFGERAILIVGADHGEAFGEHGTYQHTKTIYEELIHVPLLIHGPGIAPRRISEHVGLIDLGPTILDLFTVETPGTYMGQSLVHLLAGRRSALDRPLAAEGRLRRALYVGPSLKVIEDARRKTIEVYDLERDPDELVNLYDLDRRAVEPAVAELRAFFTAHARPGPVPYKP